MHPGWPPVSVWPDLIEASLALDPTVIGGLHDPDAIETCAATIEDLIQNF
ncbi:hypothetical protein [Methylobacterium oryzae]